MSLLYSYINPDYGYCAVWKINENQDFFERVLGCSAPQNHSQSTKRINEWLSSRYLIQQCCEVPPDGIIKDEFGKPQFRTSNKELSISHSNGYTATGFHEVPIGIDIQTFVSKIYRIQKKFTTPDEIALYSERLDHIYSLHLIWTIKEAVFKLYGRKELPFIDGIQINSIDSLEKEILSEGEIIKNGLSKKFKTRSVITKNYFLTVAIYN